ncbi:protein YkfC-like [Dermacentor variabilis]|uniref:protein YkfC-like n=1 Tax=Dermacentor variabilis TaxID=34621 RepID=UPI003F5C584E
MVIGFRPHLSTQDAMLQLKYQIIDGAGSARDNKAILRLYLQSAFDKVKHSAVLSQVSKVNMGERFYNCIKDFLMDRAAELRASDLQMQEKKLGSPGTPQGSVISPILFNLAMIRVAKELADIEDMEPTICVDDITL